MCYRSFSKAIIEQKRQYFVLWVGLGPERLVPCYKPLRSRPREDNYVNRERGEEEGVVVAVVEEEWEDEWRDHHASFSIQLWLQYGG